MENYRRVLDVLRSVPSHPYVTPIEPNGHTALSFFPGQRGFVGPSFPIGGIMLVGNNFDNLKHWLEYRDNPLAVDTTKTFKRLTQDILPAAQVELENCWLTNYALGVMDKPTSQYEFPAKVQAALQLKKKFAQFVDIMRPRLIVIMGAYVRGYVGIDRGSVRRMFGTNVIGIHHPSARGPLEQFRAEGQRIREALELDSASLR